MRRINQCLNNRLLHICQQAVQLETLTKMLIPLLPEALRPYCFVGSFNQGCLLLVTPDPIWAAQLRFLIPQLRDELRSSAGLYQLTSIKLQVKTPEQTAKRSKKMANPLTPAAKQTILQEAEHCSYLPLQAALKKLADNDTSR